MEGTEPACIKLTLESALTRALRYNRQLINTADNVTKAQYGLDIAFSEFALDIAPNGKAGYVGGGREGTGMSVGGGLDFSKKFISGTQVTVGPSILKTKEHYHTDLRALISQPLLRGFGIDYQLSGVKGAQFSLRTAARNLYMAQLQLIIRTINSLYDVIKAQKSLALNEESYQRISKFYQAAKLKERIGLSDALDVYRAEIELHHAEDSLTSAQERLQDAEDMLRDLLALPLDACIQVEVPLVYTSNPLDTDEAVKLALQNRIEIDQAQDQWRESYRLAKVAKNNLYPELNLVFNYANCGRDEIFTRSCTRHRESTWGIGFTTSTDFDPIADRAAYEQSLLAIETAARGLEQTQANLILEVKKAIRQLQRALKRIQVQEEQIHTAQSELHLAQIKFDRGMANNFDVIQAEKSLRAAEQTYWAALIDHIIGEYQLLAAIGLLTDKPCIH
ncbi:TolC family protein [Candidatus Protochlamydia phocaeensis]|uniref:TolC family protein n=1 Tax=Candidatus Protochlamydia phocaeensis TaxID=1414722 RepID=UPI0008391FE8|nr:TolC family protein [Candidatus Protochlamydia phocaeensis]